MADPLGDPDGNFSPFAFSRPTVLKSLGILRHLDRQGRGRTGGNGPELPPLPPSIRVWVQNATGAVLPTFSVVAISGVIGSIDDADAGSYAFTRDPVFSATTPTSTSDAFAILDEPAPYESGGNSGLARAVIQGVIPVDVNVTDAGHNYATPTASDNTKLTSASSGPARILYKPSGTGVKRCVVKLDESAAGGTVALTSDQTGLLSHTITASGSWQDVTSGSLILPSAGTYFIHLIANAKINNSGPGAAGLSAYVAVRLIDTTDSTEVVRGFVVATDMATQGSILYLQGSVGLSAHYSPIGSRTVKMQAYRHTNVTTWNTSELTSSDNGHTRWGWIKIA